MHDLRKLLAVIRREFVTRVRTRAFIISTIGLPLLMAAFGTLPALMANRNGTKHLVVLDAASGEFGARVTMQLAATIADSATGRRAYRVDHVAAGAGRLAAVRDSLIALTGLPKEKADGRAVDGIVVLTDSGVTGGRLQYLGVDVGSFSDMGRLQGQLRGAVTGERLLRAGIDPQVVSAVVQSFDLKTQRVSQGKLTGESGEASFLLAYIMAFVLYLGFLLYGMQVMMSVLEEKNSRIVEVLVSSLSPFELMLGKVVGICAVGLLQLGIWVATAMALTTYRVQIAGLLGVSPSAMTSMPIPTVTPQLLVVVLVFFALGFLFYASLYAAVGAMCSSQQETQQANMPVTMCIAFALLTMFAILGDPNGSLAHLLSLLPPFAPFVVPIRYSLSPMPLGGVLLSAAVTLVGVLIVVWLAARIYRVGILSYGKRPGIGELVRWIRTA